MKQPLIYILVNRLTLTMPSTSFDKKEVERAKKHLTKIYGDVYKILEAKVINDNEE